MPTPRIDILADTLVTGNSGRPRNPSTQVIFLGEETLIYNSDQLLAVETVKTLSQPAGTFRIVLKATAKPVTKSGALNIAGANYSDFSDGGESGDSINPGYWFARLKPMMLVQISYSPTKIHHLGFGLVTGGDDLDTQKKDIVMIGVVDNVTLIKQVTMAGPERVIQVTGRDLGRCYTDDTHFVFPFPILNPQTKQEDKGLIHYLNGFDKVKKLVSRYFFYEVAGDSDTTVAPYRDIYTTGNVGDILNAIHDNASGLDVQLKTKLSLRDYLPILDIAPDVATIPFMGSRLLMASGSVWSLFQQVVPNPFGEIFIDTVGTQAKLIVRRPPWGRLWKDMPDQLEKLSQFRGPDTDSIKDYVAAKGGVLWSKDEVTHTQCRVLPENNFFHPIEDFEIISMVLGKSDREVFNLYWTLASSNWAGGDKNPFHTAGFVTPMMDVESVLRFGLRLYQQENSWWNPKGVDKYGMFGNVNIQAELLLDNLRLFFWFRDNAQFLSGSITIKGRPEIRIGDYVRLESDDYMLYVESVSNTWSYGGIYTTTLGLTRGLSGADDRLADSVSSLRPPATLRNLR